MKQKKARAPPLDPAGGFAPRTPTKGEAFGIHPFWLGRGRGEWAGWGAALRAGD